LQSAASLERYSKHPLAQAILQAAQKEDLPHMAAVSVSEKPGQGLSGLVAGHEIMVTHRKKLLQIMPDLLALLPAVAPGLECIIMKGGAIRRYLSFSGCPAFRRSIVYQSPRAIAPF